MKSFRLFAVMISLAGLSQGCHRMESRRPMMRRSASDGVMVTPSPMAAPSQNSGSMGGYRPSEGS